MSAPATSSSDFWGSATHWSQVHQACSRSDWQARNEAFQAMLERYRRPIERTLRHHARPYPQLEFSAEEFLGYVLAADILKRADPARGRFRQFIQGVIRNFVRECAGRGRAKIHLDVDRCEPSAQAPEADFDREEERLWAKGLLEDALARLQPRDAALLRTTYLTPDPPSTPTLAAELSIDPPTLHRRLSRARARLQNLLIESTRHAVSTAADFDAEWTLLQQRLLEAVPGLFSDLRPEE